MSVVPLIHQSVLNFAAKYIARVPGPPRHDYNPSSGIGGASVSACEAWRFPLIESTPRNPGDQTILNRVTFVFVDQDSPAAKISVIGTFASLIDPIPLERVMFQGEPTVYRAVSCLVPASQGHRYLFLADGAPILDPINPQRMVVEDGTIWSRFFTQMYTQPVTLGPRDLALLNRLTDHILPFRTPEANRFLEYFYNFLDSQAKDTLYAKAYRLDQPVGVVNFIDKMLAASEAHHALDYAICLELIAAVLRRRHPEVEPEEVPRETFDELFAQMGGGTGAGAVDGWDYGRYGDPAYFLRLLRRHTYTGAFCHPRQGGNVGATGWAYLEETFLDAAGNTCFDWRAGQEAPFGTNPDYLG